MANHIDVKIQKISDNKAVVDVIAKEVNLKKNPASFQHIKDAIDVAECFVKPLARKNGVALDSPEYVDMLKTHIREAYEQRTPEIEMKNPTPAFIKKEIMEEVFTDIFSLEKGGLLGRSPANYLKNSHLLRSAFASIAKIYMRLQLNITDKDFAIEKGSNTIRITDALMNRYKKYVVMAFIVSATEVALRINKDTFEGFFQQLNLANHSNKELMSMKLGKAFQTVVMLAAKETFKNIKPNEIKQQISKIMPEIMVSVLGKPSKEPLPTKEQTRGLFEKVSPKEKAKLAKIKEAEEAKKQIKLFD